MSFNTLQHLEFICSGGYLGTFGTEEQAMYIYNYIYIYIYIYIYNDYNTVNPEMLASLNYTFGIH